MPVKEEASYRTGHRMKLHCDTGLINLLPISVELWTEDCLSKGREPNG